MVVPYIPLGDPSLRRSTWQRTPIPRITEYLITFIGGPYNATQRQVEVSSVPSMTDGNICQFLDMEYPTYAPGEPAQFSSIAFKYKTVFIPSSETPFTDCQCVVAVFVS